MVRLMGSTPMHSLECLTMYLCVSVVASVFVNMNICSQAHFVEPLECVSFVWVFPLSKTRCKTCHTSKIPHRFLSILYRKVTHSPLSIPFLSPLQPLWGSVTQLGSYFYWGLFNIVFLWGQTNCMPWEGCRAPLPASCYNNGNLKRTQPILHIKVCL